MSERARSSTGRAIPTKSGLVSGCLMYFVYILQSIKDNSYYIGYTRNIRARLNEHNFGRTRYTKFKRPWKLVYSEKYNTAGEAVIRERYLKTLKNRDYLIKIIG